MDSPEWLRTQLTTFTCPACGRRYRGSRMRLLAEREGLFFVDLDCSRCGSHTVAIVTVEIDETTPMGHAQLRSVDPVVLSLESGALEDPKRPRCLNHEGAVDVIGRLLYEVRDRLDPSFGDPRHGTAG